MGSHGGVECPAGEVRQLLPQMTLHRPRRAAIRNDPNQPGRQP
eukprot:COSAG04_NODE_547_length_12758_cov_24.250652_3_plen_42_part_01